MRLRLDSSAPIFASACSFGTSGAPPLPPPVPPLLPPPHPASSTAVASATAPSAVLRRRPMTALPPAASSAEAEDRLSVPAHPPPSPPPGHAGRRAAPGRLHDHEDRPVVEPDDVASGGAGVDDVDDLAVRRLLAGPRRGVDRGHADALGSQAGWRRAAEHLPCHLAVDQVGRPDEVGDERRRRPVVDLGRRADLLDPPD